MPDLDTPPTPVTHRDFLDTDAARSAIFTNVLDGVRSAYPIENDRVSLSIENPRYHKPKNFTIADQKQAILEQRSLDWPIKGTWHLRDKATGQTLAKKDKVIARVPYMTQRGTFINNGSEYTLASQQRLRPGVYARRKENGELESHINLLPGTGRSFRVHMEPETGVFKLQADQSHVPLFPILKALGASDADISQSWGPDIYHANAGKHDPNTVKKVFEKMADTKTRAAFADNHEAGLRHVFGRMGIDSDVSDRNLGKPHAVVNPEVLLRIGQKLININKGTEESDDRDSQANATIHAPEDLFKERITKDAGGVGRKLLWKSSFVKHVNHIPSGALTPQLKSALLTSGLGQALSEINPIEIVDQLGRLSRLGQGGISGDAIPAESHNVNPSQAGFIDVVSGPESASVGVDTRLAMGTTKGSDGLLYQSLLDPKTGGLSRVSARTAVHKILAFPGEWHKPGNKVPALVGGKVRFVDKDKVDFVIPHPTQMFGLGANLVPAFSSNKGGRLLMAAKAIRQALPLKDPEAPLVQAAHPDGGSFEEWAGDKVGAIKAKQPGTVIQADQDKITVRNADGTLEEKELYNSFPFNYRTFIHNTPVVKPGDAVQSGQALAKSNYTDKHGTLALGTNLRVGFLPYQQLNGESSGNYEDAIVISEGAAKRLTSEHMKQISYEPTEDNHVGKSKFISIYPGQFSKDQLKGIGDDGVIRPGTTVREGDPLILSVGTRRPQLGEAMHRTRKTYHAPDAQVWHSKNEGVVTDVHRGEDGIKVTVKNYHLMGVADKLTGRHGNKGVISSVIPDDQMPKGEDGKPLEVLLNPLGLISRSNPAQVIETLLGKIARKTGKPYHLPAFSGTNMVKFVQDELKKNNMTDTEKVFDPATNRHLDLMTGEQFFYKLYHEAELKESGRGDEGGYTAEGQPAKGKGSGAARLGLLDLNALLSHGVPEVLKDAKMVRGQRNDAFWSAFRSGQPTPLPKTAMVFDKFLAHLKGAGINVQRDGNQFHLLAMTDKDVDKLSHGELSSGDSVNGSDNSPIPGGLFDVGITGGHHGGHFSHFNLNEPLPSPVFEEPIRRLLGLTKPKFESLLKEPDGAKQIHDRLKSINVDQLLETQKQVIKSGKKSKRDDAVKLLGYLTTAKEKGIHPADLMLSKVPVIPPNFRPVTKLNHMQLTSDANILYKDLFEANQNLKGHKDRGLDPGEARLATYNALKAVTGLGDPITVKAQEKNVAGLLEHVFGKGSPKGGSFQRRVMGGTLDVVGRAAITPNPSLDMDHVGIPESKAWDVYRPFIMRRLAKRYNASGNQIPMTEIAKWIHNKDPRAKQAMLDEMAERPVLINRAPVWHRYGFMAAWPQLTAGETLQTSPVTTAGAGADYDGDQQINSVFMVVDGLTFDADRLKITAKELPMPHCLKTALVGVSDTSTAYRFFVCNLEDFPRTSELLGARDHIEFYKAPAGVYVFAHAPSGGLRLATVSGWSVHRDREVWLVTLGSGRQIITDDDERAVYGLDMDTLQWCRRKPSQCHRQFVPVVTDATVEIPTLASVPLGDGSKQNTNRAGTVHQHVAELPLDEMSGYVLGVLIGDGWIDRCHGKIKAINLANNDEQVVNGFYEGIDRLLVRAPALSRAWLSEDKLGNSMGSQRVTIAAINLANALAPLIGHGAANKHLPDFALAGSESFRKGLIAGLWDTDGSFATSNAKAKPQFMSNFSSTSLRLVQEIQHVLRSLKVTSTITPATTPKGGPCWVLTPSTPELHDLGPLPLRHTEKLKRHTAFLNGTRPAKQGAYSRNRLMPLPEALAKELRQLFRGDSRDKRYMACIEGGRKGYISKHGAEKLLTEVNNAGGCAHPLFATWASLVLDAAITFERVVSVENTQRLETGYDLTVPGCETFMSTDGIVLSNTMSYQVPVSDAAVKEAIDKMLPSRNLLSVRNFDVHMMPRQEFLAGAHLLTRPPKDKPPRVFHSKEDVIAAYRRGELDATDPVTIK